MGDFAYDKKREDDPKRYVNPPPELLIGFDWLKFRTPPFAGGLRDQPMLLMHRMRLALNVYENVKAYRQATANLSAEALTKWYGQNGKLIEFMNYVWQLQGVFNE